MDDAITLKPLNIDKVIRGLANKPKKLIAELRAGMNVGMELYKSHVIKNQLSGRVAFSYGLNRPTGNLAGSLRVTTSVAGLDIGVKLGILNKAYYAKYHQYGTAHCRKRLYFIEEFQTSGFPGIQKTVQNRMSQWTSESLV